MRRMIWVSNTTPFGREWHSLTEPTTGSRMRRFPSYLIWGDAGGGAEGTCACGAFLAEDGSPGLQFRIEPVAEGVSKIHEGAFGDAAGDFGYEGEVLLLASIEGLVEVLPGGPRHVIGAAEAVGGDAEVVDEPVYADGAAAVPVLVDGEGDWNRVAGW